MKRRIVENLQLEVEQVSTIDVFTIEGNLTKTELKKAATGPLSDPVIQKHAINSALADGFDWLIEVGFRPGVTDNVGKTATEAIELLIEKRKPLRVYTSRQYVIHGKIGRAEAERIASGVLANDLIERYEIVEGKGWDARKGMTPYVPKVAGVDDPRVDEIDLNVPDAALMEISSRGTLALSLEEMKAIQAYMNDPAVIEARKRAGLGELITDVELEVLAQTWSEHCKHKIFNSFIRYEEQGGKTLEIDSLFSTCIKGSTKEIRQRLGADDWCLSVFVDNAGVIKFNDDWNLVFKVETHNSPSALDPYGGALTGIVGVNRDPFGTGMGARLIFNTDVFCFADPFYDKPLPKRILHPRRIYEGVREGVEHGGNKSGIPTVNGCIVFDDRFLGKPLVYCGTAGIMPAEILGEPSYEQVDPARRSRRHDGGPHRQGRHPRGDVLLRGAPRGIARVGRADRRPHHAEEDDGLSAHRERPRPVPGHHRQRGRRPVVLHRRDGAHVRRRGAGPEACPAQVRRPQPLGDPALRGAGADEPRHPAREDRRVHGTGPQDGGGGHHPGEIHRYREVPHPLRRKDDWPASTWNSSTRACPR